ncbi:S41 family peptidase [Gloeobacter kilaueensis]|uniref:Peptidase S41 n=1 Tax=Gloeobacter kilaueensis (strain ATCC BAA-2537 / CCAP 1431/1 / ULC 316 / JS1) TaxID=1183438 RepID=U5QNX5_GLOK1|nr:S41 family peptidase [Gloeobacter kilaueensis]AGY60641.1 peptidase S41 [Gloeobacter kilaueensis JS1]
MFSTVARRQRRAVVAVALSLVLLGAGPASAQPPSASLSTFEEVWQTVKDHFYDPKLGGIDWRAIREKYREQAALAASGEQLAGAINRMLLELHASHTRYYTRQEPAFYQLLGGVFRSSPAWRKFKKQFPGEELSYTEIGVFTSKEETGTLVTAVLDDSPARKAGLQVGDVIVAVDGEPGFEPIDSFKGKVAKPVVLSVRRTGKIAKLTVVPKNYDPATMFLDAMRDSAELIEQDGKTIGYIHVWSYAGEQYQQLLKKELFSGKLQRADALILDLRNGWGGASPEYLNIFTAQQPALTIQSRDGKPANLTELWKKPVVLLVNEQTRSGKEILAYGFKKYAIGPVIGTRTAGAVLAGSPFLLKDGSLLYLAVANVWVDGERLEGTGVTPDIEVPPDFERGDLQKQKAIEVLLGKLATAGPAGGSYNLGQ